MSHLVIGELSKMAATVQTVPPEKPITTRAAHTTLPHLEAGDSVGPVCPERGHWSYERWGFVRGGQTHAVHVQRATSIS